MNISERIDNVNQVIRQAEATYHRLPGSVNLLAVSKGHGCQDIELAFNAGIDNFGENYLQEALVKIQTLSMLPLCWHFIGSIQGNKTRAIAQNFAWVHGLCRKNIAQRLSDERPASMPPLNVCIQINVDNEDTKSGVSPERAGELAAEIMQLPRLILRGLMVIPKPTGDKQQQYLTYESVTNLLHTLNAKLNLNMDTLSMGMSDDLTAAIRAGSTMVRVGRGIFGERLYKTR